VDARDGSDFVRKLTADIAQQHDIVFADDDAALLETDRACRFNPVRAARTAVGL
jgi:hypothetical protein